MTALAADKQIEYREGVELEFEMAATEKVFGGALA